MSRFYLSVPIVWEMHIFRARADLLTIGVLREFSQIWKVKHLVHDYSFTINGYLTKDHRVKVPSTIKKNLLKIRNVQHLTLRTFGNGAGTFFLKLRCSSSSIESAQFVQKLFFQIFILSRRFTSFIQTKMNYSFWYKFCIIER